MQDKYVCPFCHADIGIDDVNPAKDLALCRSCGKTSPFSVLCGAAALTSENLSIPPKCVRILSEGGGDTILRYRRISPILLFLVPFTLLWSGLSMAGIYGKQIKHGHFDLVQSLMGIPFLIGTVALVSSIIYMLLGHCLIRLRGGEGCVFYGIGKLGWTRRFRYNRQSLVSVEMSGRRVNNVPQRVVVLRTDGKTFMFGSMWKDQAKEYVAAVIMREIMQCRQ